MKPGSRGRLSLLWKILLATTLPITIVLAFTAWFVESQTVTALTRDLEEAMRGGFEAYTSLWKSRADNLRSISMVLSMMSDVRAAFQTNDRATIRDTAQEIWSKVSQSGAFFLVTDPRGRVMASLGGAPVDAGDLGIVNAASSRFPDQIEGFSVQSGALYELVITPVYVHTSTEPGLLNVLVAGFAVDPSVAADLKRRTGGSDFIFRAPGCATVSTLPARETSQILARYEHRPGLQRMQLPEEFAVLGNPLNDVGGRPLGDLLMVRSYEPVRSGIQELQSRLIWIWGTAILGAALMSSLIARRTLRPIHQLDRAATRIANQDYSARVPEAGGDELARLARTFNQMSASIQEARAELIAHERIGTIGRMATSIVHDLRNPLAAIYGGAEMMVDGELNEEQTRRVAQNIYRSSRVIKDLLQELADVSRGRIQTPEACSLYEVVDAALESQRTYAAEQNVTIRCSIDPAIEVLLERARMERVFLNLVNNALEVMPGGGVLTIAAVRDPEGAVVRVADTGPGIPAAIRDRLFEPFVTASGNGLGLGLALARQTVLAHGGELWLEDVTPQGACFCMRLPLA